MSERRFTVKWCRGGRGATDQRGWAVFDRGHRITRAFPEYGEAELRCANIARLYARWGW